MTVEKLFSEEAKIKIAEAVRKAETQTSGEIVPLVVNASDHYTYVHFVGAVIGQILFVGIGLLIFSDWDLPILLALQTSGFIVGYFLTRRIPALKRFLLSPATAEAQVYDRALKAFYENELFRTRDRTGILIFVSLLEHRIQILADTGINARVPPGTWNDIVRILLKSITRGDLCQGLCEAIAGCAEILSRDFPHKPDDTDELPDQLRIEE